MFAELSEVYALSLWNVKFPLNLWENMPQLRWLEVIGGSGTDLDAYRAAKDLRYLEVRHVRGIQDISAIESMPHLIRVDIYGQAQVKTLPNLKALSNLRFLQLGQMIRLESLDPVWEMSGLKELLLINQIKLTEEDMDRVQLHPSIERFDHFNEKATGRQFDELKKRIQKPKAKTTHAISWFKENNLLPELGITDPFWLNRDKI